jgi:predicted secreted acid phosphatase
VTSVTNEAGGYLTGRLVNPAERTAIVLDIDNTALASSYASGWSIPATPPVLVLARQAKLAGAAIFFVTARWSSLYSATRDSLEQAGYPIDGLYTHDDFSFEPIQEYKTNSRIAIEKLGYTIVANIGNNLTDLAGGHAERTFKLPDYSGQLG